MKVRNSKLSANIAAVNPDQNWAESDFTDYESDGVLLRRSSRWGDCERARYAYSQSDIGDAGELYDHHALNQVVEDLQFGHDMRL